MNPIDCMHAALRIETDRFWCSACKAEFERKPATEHIAEMRALLGSKPKSKPAVVPAPIPKGPDRGADT